jgi:two-component system, NarL family, response regulator LiaR
MSKQKQKPLTPAEFAILQLLANGFMYKEMADIKKLNINTIKKHCSNIYKKLNLRNRTEATNYYNTLKAA